MNENFKAKSIVASLAGEWKDVIDLCQKFLKYDPGDTEMLNRLAYAYLATGNIKNAKLTYQKVLKIDALNPIANKNYKRLSEQNNRKIPEISYQLDNSMFLEEVGKTKVIDLINPAPPRILRTLRVGQPLKLHIKRLKIFVLDSADEFIGMLPDNISKRLIKFIGAGNKYDAYIRAAEETCVEIFVKEIKRSTRYKNQPTFLIHETKKNTGIFSGKKNYDLDDDDGKSEE